MGVLISSKPRLAAWIAGLAIAAGLAVPASAGELRLQIEGEVGVRNDGNYLQQQQQPGEEPEDRSIARGGVGFHLSYTLPRTELAFIYSPSYEQDLDNSELSGTTHRLDLGLQSELTRRLRMRIRERLLKSPNLDLYVPLTQTEPLAVTRRGDQLSHNLDVSFEHDLTRRVVASVEAEHSLRTFENSDLYDTETLTGRLATRYEFAEDHAIGVEAGMGRFDYGDRGDADVQDAALTYTQSWGRDIRLDLEAGVFSVDSTLLRRAVLVPDDPTGPPQGEIVEEKESHTGWRGAFGFSQQRRLFSWGAGYRHGVSAGFGLGRPTEADSVFANISTEVGRRLTLGLDGNASRHRDLAERDLTTTTDTSRDDTLDEFAAGTVRFGWAFFPGLRLTGGYSRIWQDSNVEPFADLSYDRYFLGLAFRIWSTGDKPRDPDLPPDTPDAQGEPTDEARQPQPPVAH